MTFAVGERVVHPSHGAALVEKLETRRIDGEDRAYLVLHIASNGMVVHVPACNVDLVGVRQVIDGAGREGVVAALRADDSEDSLSWSSRYRANTAKMRGGEAIRVAEVVRDLWRRNRARGLSAAEHRMFAEARQILVSELAVCDNTDEKGAGSLLDELLAG